MAYAYETASSEARKSAERQKGYYDYKVRYMKLEVGDRVLVKNVGLHGKQKLADLWEHCPYVVKSQPVPAIPVYEVYKKILLDLNQEFSTAICYYHSPDYHARGHTHRVNGQL